MAIVTKPVTKPVAAPAVAAAPAKPAAPAPAPAKPAPAKPAAPAVAAAPAKPAAPQKPVAAAPAAPAPAPAPGASVKASEILATLAQLTSRVEALEKALAKKAAQSTAPRVTGPWGAEDAERAAKIAAALTEADWRKTLDGAIVPLRPWAMTDGVVGAVEGEPLPVLLVLPHDGVGEGLKGGLPGAAIRATGRLLALWQRSEDDGFLLDGGCALTMSDVSTLWAD